MLRKTPVDSTTYWAPTLPQGISFGFMLDSGKVKENFNRAQVAEGSAVETVDSKHHCHVPLENSDGVITDDHLARLLSDLTLVTAVSRIIFEHVGLKRTGK